MTTSSGRFQSNHRALVLVGRNNPEIPDRSPFSPLASAFCIEPGGVIVTSWHTLDDFFRTWTVLQFDGTNQPCERHEMPTFSFFAELGPPGEIQLFPPRSLYACPDTDVAIVRLQDNHTYAPLPSLELASVAPLVGDRIELVAHYQPGTPPKDPDGLTLGWAVTFQQANVVRLQSDSFFIDYLASKGMSGAPVCDPTTKQVLGMVSEVWSRSAAQRELGVDVPVTRITGVSTIKECYHASAA